MPTSRLISITNKIKHPRALLLLCPQFSLPKQLLLLLPQLLHLLHLPHPKPTEYMV